MRDALRSFLETDPSFGAPHRAIGDQVMGKRHDLGLGAYPEVSLAMARDRALQARRMIQEGEDPIVQERQAQPKTFKDAALELIESKRPGWKNAKHAAQWTSTLQACPRRGA